MARKDKASHLMKYNIIGFTLGLLLMIIGLAELIPAFVDQKMAHPNANVFFVNALFSFFFGGALVISNKTFRHELDIRQAFLLTTLSWLSVSLFAALPLYMSDLNISFTDAFFESLSGITTTGSTVLSGLDAMSDGILLWRSIIQWIGGIGLVGFAIILLPFLRIGGMQLFQTESSDKSDKVMPKSVDVIIALFIVYCGLTAACTLTFYMLGMSFFDAVNHAMTTIPTGGYSTHDASFGYFKNSSALQLACTFYMLLGGLPFILYIKFFFQGRTRTFFYDDQVRTFIILVAILTFILTIWLTTHSDYTLWQSFVATSFNIVSVITTTGYATEDYTLWGPFSVMFFLFLTYVGSCAGSTAGGLKIMRLNIIAKALFKQLNTLIHPNGVFTIRYQRSVIDQSIVDTILGFSGLYVLSNVILTLALTLLGLDFPTAVSGAATSLANVGPGIGDIIGPAGNFSTLPDSAKWLLCLGMLLGRLEILTVAVLFSARFWKK